MKKKKNNKYLNKLNIIFILLSAAVNIFCFIFAATDKGTYTFLSVYLNIFLFIIYNSLLIKKAGKSPNTLTKEINDINYPLRILIFSVLTVILLIGCYSVLYSANKEAADLTFSFMFFTQILSMLFPSVIFCMLICLILPAFVIPNLNSKNIEKSSYKYICIITVLIFIIFGFVKLFYNIQSDKENADNKKYRAYAMNFEFPQKYLKYDESINAYTKKKLMLDEVKLPFLYTKKSFKFEDYGKAYEFCGSLGARIPNHREIYHIIFNNFDTFDDKYYLTSDIENDDIYFLHFKNMSYTVTKNLPKNTQPVLYCVADTDENYDDRGKKYFIKRENDIKTKREDKKVRTDVREPDIEELLRQDKYSKLNKFFERTSEINTEKKHISFCVKEVPRSVFEQYRNKGYVYNPDSNLRKDYESNDAKLKTIMNKDNSYNEIRLCYFPFIDYSNISIEEEKELWGNGFCSPAFKLTALTPKIKRYDETTDYCFIRNGRLPNIAELYGILKTKDEISDGNVYWIFNGKNKPYALKIVNGNFVKILPLNSTERAYTYCVGAPEKTSIVIANYSSRFPGITARSRAKELCPRCVLYEVPDAVLRK